MLYSRHKRFLFIKTRKTASTSLEIFFSQFCGDGDIVTPVTPEDEITRFDLGGCLPQNFSRNPQLEAAYRDAIRSRKANRIRQARRPVELVFRNHFTLADVRGHFEIPDDYLVISSERHPYEKVLSMTAFRLRDNPVGESEFHQELNREIEGRLYRNIDAYRDPRGILEHRVIRYENLQEDLQLLCEELGFPFDPSRLPQTKTGYRASGDKMRFALTESQKRRVADICRDEFIAYDYET